MFHGGVLLTEMAAVEHRSELKMRREVCWEWGFDVFPDAIEPGLVVKPI
jgi:hypothetical protein